MLPSLQAILHAAINNGASDIHLSTNSQPRIRCLGEIYPFDDAQKLNSRDIATIHASLLPGDLYKTAYGKNDPSHIDTFPKGIPSDFSYADLSSGRRFRVNAYTTVRGPALAMRLIPDTISTLDEINAPEALTLFAQLDRGLVLVTGPTGSGKSATLAATIHHINQTRRAHILTLEDPIEYLHEDINSLVSQREIHTHARGYTAALKDALREDPDVILVGEMRDPETIRLALTAAETGHLVLSTLHTRSAAQAVDRIIDVFPAGEKEAVRTMLAESLRGIVAQQLVRHRVDNKRLAVFEVLANTPAIRNCIRESQTGQILGLMSTGRESGMITLDQALKAKIQSGEITRETAAHVAADPKLFL